MGICLLSPPLVVPAFSFVSGENKYRPRLTLSSTIGPNFLTFGNNRFYPKGIL